MNDKTKQILLTNDDSIHSPGLWAAAEALDPLGFVHVVAPREQQTSTGHSMPFGSSGVIDEMTLHVNGKDWQVYAVDGSPGQSVLHGVYEVMKEKPDILVSGINYGENIGIGITISGTVGAALEAASLGIPGLAVSLQTDEEHILSLSHDIDFSTAGFFTQKFARVILENQLPEDVDLLKLDVPGNATPETPWVLTRLSRKRYYFPNPTPRKSFSDHGPMSYKTHYEPNDLDRGSDVYALLEENKVSLTPLSIDLTSRVKFETLELLLNQ